MTQECINLVIMYIIAGLNVWAQCKRRMCLYLSDFARPICFIIVMLFWPLALIFDDKG